MKKIILLTSLCLFCSLPMFSEFVYKTVNINTAGTLIDSLPITERNTVTHLTITGTIDARDFKTMRDLMPVLENLTLTNAQIVSYYGPDGTSDSGNAEFYPENVLPHHAFYHSSEDKGLKAVVLPTSITKIGQHAFYYCSGLTSITIPEGVTSIDQFAFFYCKGLSEVIFPVSVTNISAYAFMSCSALTSVSYSSSTTTIGPFAFAYCIGLTNVTLTSKITTLGSQAFAYCSGLTSVNISSSMLYIGEKAFAYCVELSSIKIPASIQSLGMNVLYGCCKLDSIIVNDSNLVYSSLDGVLFDKNQSFLLSFPIARSGVYSIPNTVTDIEMYAFANSTNLTSIEIPSSVKSIGAYAFSSCSNLSEITLPESISTINVQTFANCSGLNTIRIKSLIPPEVYTDGLKNISRTNCTVYVPKGMRTFYIDAPTWSEFSRILEEGDITTENTITKTIENRIYAQNGTLVVESNEANQLVQIFTVNGSLVKSVQTIDLTTTISLPQGIYLVKAGANTVKIAL